MRVPLTIVGGYLGAGKTTLINRLLAEDHGMRLAVLVNDFGAINIDDALISAGGGRTIALTNGCVCCSIGDDLARALDRVLSDGARPDHLIVEASGVADPAAIANAARAVPDTGHAAIVTLVDAVNAPALLDDPELGAQLRQQVAAADLVLVTKAGDIAAGLADRLGPAAGRATALSGDAPLAQLLLDTVPLPRGRAAAPHPAYTAWQHDSDRVLDRRRLGDMLDRRPAGLYRLKGFVRTNAGGYEIHAVGRNVEARRAATDRTRLVGLGPASRITRDEIETWWQGAAP